MDNIEIDLENKVFVCCVTNLVAITHGYVCGLEWSTYYREQELLLSKEVERQLSLCIGNAFANLAKAAVLKQ